MILEDDVSLSEQTEFGHSVEFACRDLGEEFARIHVDFDHEFVVEVVLDDAVAGDDASDVPLADRAGVVVIGAVKGVHRAGGGHRIAAIGVLGVIEDLVFGAGLPRSKAFTKLCVDHDAAVGSRGNFPFKGEVEVFVGAGGAEIAAFDARGEGKNSALEGPSAGDGIAVPPGEVGH